jgi:hypothetical protein
VKHPSNRDFLAQWNAARGAALAPDRNAFTPESVRHLLSDVFVLSLEAAKGFPFRVAGTRICARAGRDLKGESFASMFSSEARHDVEDLVSIVAEECLPTVVGLTAAASNSGLAHIEMLLLPFSTRVHTPTSITGQFAFFTENPGSIGPFGLTSWRHIHQNDRSFGPRILRKLEIVRGLTVYEGLR